MRNKRGLGMFSESHQAKSIPAPMIGAQTAITIVLLISANQSDLDKFA
jgi:hypothetical protein